MTAKSKKNPPHPSPKTTKPPKPKAKSKAPAVVSGKRYRDLEAELEKVREENASLKARNLVLDRDLRDGYYSKFDAQKKATKPTKLLRIIRDLINHEP